MVLAIGHTLRAHEALSRPDALLGFLGVIHRLFENGGFVGQKQSIRVDSILRWVDGPGSHGLQPKTWYSKDAVDRCGFYGE